MSFPTIVTQPSTNYQVSFHFLHVIHFITFSTLLLFVVLWSLAWERSMDARFLVRTKTNAPLLHTINWHGQEQVSMQLVNYPACTSTPSTSEFVKSGTQNKPRFITSRPGLRTRDEVWLILTRGRIGLRRPSPIFSFSSLITWKFKRVINAFGYQLYYYRCARKISSIMNLGRFGAFWHFLVASPLMSLE